jgi:hypothetical protein
VRILGEGVIEAPEVLVKHGVVADRVVPLVELLARGQLAVDEQVRDLDGYPRYRRIPFSPLMKLIALWQLPVFL